MEQPQAWHRVEAATDDVEWYWNFIVNLRIISLRNQYNTNPVHSEVLEAMQTVMQGKPWIWAVVKAMHSFLAQHGFDVTATDQNES